MTISKAGAPKRKEEYMSPSNIDLVHDDILEKGMMLKTVSGMKFLMLKRLAMPLLICLVLLSGTIWLGSGSVPQQPKKFAM
jgi:hypothetical protein